MWARGAGDAAHDQHGTERQPQPAMDGDPDAPAGPNECRPCGRQKAVRTDKVSVRGDPGRAMTPPSDARWSA